MSDYLLMGKDQSKVSKEKKESVLGAIKKHKSKDKEKSKGDKDITIRNDR